MYINILTGETVDEVQIKNVSLSRNPTKEVLRHYNYAKVVIVEPPMPELGYYAVRGAIEKDGDVYRQTWLLRETNTGK
jgi:hypothetical protein